MALPALFFCSGAAGLGYQMVWTRMFAVGLGHEMPAVLAVVAAFLGGIALGAWALDGRMARRFGPGPYYALLEFVIGAWAFLSPALIPLVNDWARVLLGPAPAPVLHWLVAFALAFVALLPATAAMGGTLPAMERFLAPLVAGQRCLGTIYSANTLGAVAGTLGLTFFVTPALGLRAGVWLLGMVNLGCGGAALALARRLHAPADVLGQTRASSPREPVEERPLRNARLSVTLFATGLLGIGYEVLGVRALAQVLEGTVFTFAAVLAVYLLGTAAGAACYQRWGRTLEPRRLLADLLGGLAVTCLLGALALTWTYGLYQATRAAWGEPALAVMVAEMTVAALVFGMPTVLMGATFSHLAQTARGTSGGVGRAVALNALGGALAPWLFGVGLLPRLEMKGAWVVLGLGYMGLLPGAVGWRWAWVGMPVLLAFAVPARLPSVPMPAGETALRHREGVMATVTVLENASGHRTLRVDHRFQMGGTGAAEAQYRQAHLPLLLHPAPRRALFLGAGTGITMGGASLHPGLHTEGVELVPEVVEAMPAFISHNFSPPTHPSMRVHTADARRFVQSTATRYDVIVADLFHPARDGAGALYTVEHFRAVRHRLTSNGLFCQWLPLHQLDAAMLRVVVRTFLEVFPEAQAWLLRFNMDTPVVGLIGRIAPGLLATNWLEGQQLSGDLAAQLKQLAWTDSIRLFGHCVSDAEGLRRFAAAAPLNTDDRPRVTFGAPRVAFRKNAAPYATWLAFTREARTESAAHLVNTDLTGVFSQRLRAFWRARDVYLGGLIAESGGQGARAVNAYVESARISRDFTAGYAQVLTLASLQAKGDGAGARALLQRLVEVRPDLTVARDLLERLGGASQ